MTLQHEEESGGGQQAIKTMQLYTHVDRVYSELAERGIEPQDSLHPVELSEIDSLHYLGNEAIRNGIQEMQLKKDASVLDVGSGLGGPARLLAYWTQCRVDALELQGDLHEIAAQLTKRCHLSNEIHHLQGDFLNMPVEHQYDALCSWLVFLHIENQAGLFAKCRDSLKPGGVLYVEDFYQRGHFTPEENLLLQRDVYVNQLPTKSQLESSLQRAGLEVLKIVDMTQEWTDFCSERLEQYRIGLDRHERVHGKEGARGLLHFYTSVQTLFESGHLGGVAYTARKA